MTDTSDRSILAGENLSLECQAKAFPAAKVTWYFEGEPIKSSPRILVTDNQLRIFQTEEEDSGKYSCGYSYERFPNIESNSEAEIFGCISTSSLSVK